MGSKTQGQEFIHLEEDKYYVRLTLKLHLNNRNGKLKNV